MENPFLGKNCYLGSSASPIKWGLLACLAALFLLFSAAPRAEAQVTPKPFFKLIGIHMPTHVKAASTGNELLLVASNIGGASTVGQVTITDTLPTGLTPTSVSARDTDPDSPNPTCAPLVDQTLTCSAGPIGSGRLVQMRVLFDAAPLLAKGEIPDEASLSGGGAPPVSVETTTTIDPTPATFGLLQTREGGPESLITEADGSPATAAGSHPYQLTTSIGFPTEKSPTNELLGAGTVRDIAVDLPRGLIVNPTATPVLCTEAVLASVGKPECPLASQVGLVFVTTVAGSPESAPHPLYNMVPPPGTAAQLGFNALGIGVLVHIEGSVRSEDDYGITGEAKEAFAKPQNPAFGATVELWGDPLGPLHDRVRSEQCLLDGEPCPVDPAELTDTAQLSLPSECSGEPLKTKFRADSWAEPDVEREGSYEGDAVDGCNAPKFEPTIEARPTTGLADSPSGFEFTLRQPQDFDLEGLSSAPLKDATVTLPEGLVVNPAAASGQEACSLTQIGLTSGVGQSPVRFNKDPDGCPDAAKIGTIEVKTPLLAEMNEALTEALRDPEGNVIARPLKGDVYLAEPFQNPFGSLLAIYFAIEDPKSGTVAKFATQVSADPVTGRLTNTLTESPQLPLEEVSLNIFEGDRAALRTPPACAAYETTTNLVPWSAPEGPSANPSDSFAISGVPGGGTCPSSPQAAPHSPAFVAGTVAPQAGAHSPFLLRISREDATQPIGGFEATLPPGLSAKLAGVAVCSDAQIAQAEGRGDPNEGKIEQASPSCPAASELGSVDVAAGAGPTPFHTTGRVYLAGPYKGAPLSVVIITAALAGPFDLGTVVVRSALYVDPKSAQVRAVSDPLPTILEGIPLDLRSASLRMDRPQFTLNPTSCEPFSTKAIATSVFGQAASLSSRFQVGGCEALPFKPKLALRLRGGTSRGAHPRLQGTLTMKPGEANIAATSVALPRSAFLDQSHIRTVCTRVQFAASQCPKGAIYGHVKATTPLLDEVLEGPVYLRSSDNELPDAVGVLRGPASRPIMIEVSARIDSFKRGIRANFEAVPDAPVSKVVVTMQGGKKGLLINSKNLCKTKRSLRSATVRMRGQNGKAHNFRSVMKNDCGKKKRGKGKARGRHGRR